MNCVITRLLSGMYFSLNNSVVKIGYKRRSDYKQEMIINREWKRRGWRGSAL